MLRETFFFCCGSGKLKLSCGGINIYTVLMYMEVHVHITKVGDDIEHLHTHVCFGKGTMFQNLGG